MELQEIKNSSRLITEEEEEQSNKDIIEENRNSNIYLIFTINKTIFEKNQINLQLAGFKQQNTILIKYDEMKDKTKKNLIIHQLYCITYIRPKIDAKTFELCLVLQLKNNTDWIKSYKISVPNREYFFLYEHSFEDINKFHNNKNDVRNLKIIQNKLDLQQKFSFFLKKLNPEKWENAPLTKSFLVDTLIIVKKESMPPYNILFNLIEMSNDKHNIFYHILEYFYLNQKKIYFPKSFNVKKYKSFVDKLAEDKMMYYNLENHSEEIEEGKYLNNKEKLTLYFKVFKEAFYRKYDRDNYIGLSNDINYSEIIKEQIKSRVITKEDNIDIKVLSNIMKNMSSPNEIVELLQLFTNLSKTLDFIINNFENIKKIYINTKECINIDEINEKVEEDDFENIKNKHENILKLEKECKFMFINFYVIIHKWINQFSYTNLNVLLIIREMILNHKLYGDNLMKGTEERINNAIHETGISNAKSLKSNEIIDFMINIDKNKYIRKDLYIVRSINIYEIKEEDFIKFNEIWTKINNDNYEFLVKLIFEKINTMKDFGLIFKLIPEIIFNANSLVLLVNLFKNLFYSYNEKVCQNIDNDIKNILKVFIISSSSPNEFLDFIEHKLSKIKINNLYLDIIKNDRNLSGNASIKKRIIKFFTQQSYLNDIETIIYILGDINSSNNKSFISDFLSGLDNFIIVEEDFFIKQYNTKFRLYKHVKEIFKIKNKELNYNNNYFNKSNQTLSILLNRINNFEFDFNEVTLISQQIDQQFFKEKLVLINYLS